MAVFIGKWKIKKSRLLEVFCRWSGSNEDHGVDQRQLFAQLPHSYRQMETPLAEMAVDCTSSHYYWTLIQNQWPEISFLPLTCSSLFNWFFLLLMALSFNWFFQRYSRMHCRSTARGSEAMFNLRKKNTSFFLNFALFPEHHYWFFY